MVVFDFLSPLQEKNRKVLIFSQWFDGYKSTIFVHTSLNQIWRQTEFSEAGKGRETYENERQADGKFIVWITEEPVSFPQWQRWELALQVPLQTPEIREEH